MKILFPLSLNRQNMAVNLPAGAQERQVRHLLRKAFNSVHSLNCI